VSGRDSFDLIVVGGGSAGFAAAIAAAGRGARTAIVESGTLGGTCVNVGCVPSKTLIRAAEVRHRRAHHGFAGIATSQEPVEWPAVRGAKDQLVATLRQAKYADVLAAYDGIELVRQRAQLEPGRVRLADGRVLRAGKTIVATGSSPWAPPIPGLDGVPYLDSTSAMALDELPASLAVVGASAVGLELAQTFARLGVAVTVLEAQPNVVPAEDAMVGHALAGYLRDEGLDIETGVRIERVSAAGGRVTIDAAIGTRRRAVTADRLLVSTGRRANTRGLGLEDVGVALGPKGEIVVDHTLRTANPDVYAAGDVIGDPMFVYVAAYGGALAAENALTGAARRYDLMALPRVTFTDPAVASVGLSAAQAAAGGIEALVSTLPMEHVPRALAARDTRGFVTLVADAATRRIVGAQILASEAGEMITEPALAIRHGLTIEDLTSAFHPYLTLSEGIRLAAQTFDRDVKALSCCAA